MKYVIKNCPCLFNAYYASGKTVILECNDGNHEDKLCCDVADCLLKQIVEKCKEAKDECSCKIRNYVKCFECTSGGRASLGKEILELLEIEECE